jgi:chromosome partitioning protein
MLSIALVNAKPGTGKTTSAVWLAHAFHQAGNPVLLIDADPAASALEWSDQAGGFAFRIAGLPVKDLHRRVSDYARPDDVVVIDCPQLEDHSGIARSALRVADEIVIPCAPTTVEISRTAPMAAEIEAIDPARVTPARACILLNRTVAHANSTPAARETFEAMGYDVLWTTVPRLEIFAQSFGGPLPMTGADVWSSVAADLIHRAQIAEVTR